MSERRRANGFLFIGDPHLTSVRPGRRTDVDFAASVLTKIEQAVTIANERGLIAAFLGDMFAIAKEDEQSAITRLIRHLRRLWTVGLANVGNHDIQHTTLSDRDSLKLVAESRVLTVVEKSGPVEVFEMGPEGRLVGLGMTPYGQPIPQDVSGMFPAADIVIWMTHHDLRFKDVYTKTEPLFEIAGCSIAVNGHIHLSKPIEQVGQTLWLNPGNITRMSADEVDNEPAVWAWTPETGFERIPLPDPPGLFDLTGYNVEAAGPAATAASVREETSAFVELLRTESSLEMSVSDDGSLLREEIEAKCEREKVPGGVRTIVLSLLEQAVATAQ